MSVKSVPEQIRTAAHAIDAAAGTVRSHVPTEVSHVDEALPGTTSAALATQLSQTWSRRLRAWSTAAERHAEAMRSAAADWQTTDHTNAARMARIAREMR